MTIRFKNFRLEQQSIKGFDLYKEVKARKIGTGTIKEPNGEEYLRDEFIGYNMSFEKCMEEIIHNIQSEEDVVVTVQGFLESYKKLKNEILDILV